MIPKKILENDDELLEEVYFDWNNIKTERKKQLI